MVLESRLTWSVVYNFCVVRCVEGSGGHHEVSEDFTKVYDLNMDIPYEVIAGPLPNDHDLFRVYYC